MSLSLSATVRPASGAIPIPRLLLAAVAAGAVMAGFMATGSADSLRAASLAGADLTRLLRAMAAIKMLMAACVAGCVFWRLGSAIGPVRFAFYALACAAMAAGPGLIWGMVHVGSGALALHAGLAASILLLWRDPEMAYRLSAMVAARRRALRS